MEEYIYKIGIRRKVPYLISGPEYIVTDNTDYRVELSPDEEWEDFPAKSFIYAFDNGKMVVDPITGNTGAIPMVPGNAGKLHFGVSAGEMHTTTWLTIPVRGSVRRKGGVEVPPPTPDQYDKIMDMLNKVMGQVGGGKYPVEIFTEPASFDLDGNITYQVVMVLSDKTRLTAKLPSMGLTLTDVTQYGTTDPTSNTAGMTRQFYVNTVTGEMWTCTDGGEQSTTEWRKLGRKMVLSGSKDPTKEVVEGEVDQLYVNTDTGAIYICTFASNGPMWYEWEWKQIGGTGGSGDVGTDITLGITGAVVGKTVKITEVDEDGRPVKWEAADIPARTDIDSTLSIEGAAADAAEVGKKFTELSSAISDKITAPSTVTVGQTIVVSEVDENGKPTKWEAIDMASGGTSDAVQYISQELTDEQQMQTRENLGLYRKMVELKDSASVTVVKNNGLDAEIIGIKIYPATQGGAWEEGDTIRVEIGTYVFEGTVSIDAIGYQEYGVFVDLRIPINTWANYYLRYDPLETKWTMSGDYEFTLETTETMRIYKVQLHPVPEEYIPDTIARKEDIDSTLSIEGAAADAKAVGDKVAELSGAIAAIPSGKDGITPTIGDNGNWYLGDTDTGKPSRGETGQAGANGDTPVKGTDYFTEADKQEIAAAAAGMVSIPDKLPNPNALTFTGAVTGTYDGSAPVTVNIPSSGEGGSGGGALPNWRLIKTISISTEIASYDFNTDDNGDSFALKEIMLAGTVPSYSGYIYTKTLSTGVQNTIWPTAGKELRWWSASVSGILKTMLAVSNASCIWPVDKRTECHNDTISRLIIGASEGFTSDGTMYVYGR